MPSFRRASTSCNQHFTEPSALCVPLALKRFGRQLPGPAGLEEGTVVPSAHGRPLLQQPWRRDMIMSVMFARGGVGNWIPSTHPTSNTCWRTDSHTDRASW